MKPVHFIALALILSLGLFNGITGLSPQIKQYKREQNIAKVFNRWWQDAGAQEFRQAGLEPTKQIKNEEFERYREKYLQQNPSYIIEDRIKVMKKDYRDWWDNQGGREAFFQENGRFPNEADYKRGLDSWINSFTDKFLRYNLAFVPKRGDYKKVLTCWMLFPGVCSFLIFATLFFVAISQIVRRWNLLFILGFTALATLIAPISVDCLAATSFFDHYADERYMGMSLTVAFLLGVICFSHRRVPVKPMVTNICILGTILDMIVNWFINPGIFGAVTVLTPVYFGLGVLAGTKLEPRRKSREEVNAENLEKRLRENASKNPIAERKAKTRALIEEGFASAKNGLPEQAHQQISTAITMLLQEHPVDANLVKTTIERVTAPDQYLEFSSNQWMEWGETAKAKNAPEAAVLLLKKSLSLEKSANFARRALFILGEISINNKIDIEDGVARLKKVIEMNGNDILAMQAKRMLESQSEKTANQ